MSNLNFILVFVKFKLWVGGTKVIKIWNPIVCFQLTFQQFFKSFAINFSFHGNLIRLTHHSYIFGTSSPLRLSYSLMRRLCFFSVFHHLELFLALGSLYSFPLLLIQLIKNNHCRALSLTFHYFLKCHLLTGQSFLFNVTINATGDFHETFSYSFLL